MNTQASIPALPAVTPVPGLWQRHRELFWYLFVGGTTALFSIAQLWLFHEIFGWRTDVAGAAAYAVQSVTCIQANFTLNYFITFRHTAGGAWTKLWKFNLTRLATIPIAEAVYLTLVYVHVDYQIANVVTILGATLANFVVGKRYIFTPSTPQSK